MVESRIDQDLVDEQEIAKFLDSYFYSELPNRFNAIQDIFINHFSENKDDQYKGVDLTITYKNNTRINIDEKAANNYFNKKLSTFALEISFFNGNNVSKDGWLYGQQYSKTDCYLFCWGETHDPKEGITFENIKKIEAYSIKKEKLRALLDTLYGINVDNFLEKAKEAKQALHHKKSKAKLRIGGEDSPYWVLSHHLSEKPLNLVCPKEILQKVTEYKFYIEKNSLKILTENENKEWVECK